MDLKKVEKLIELMHKHKLHQLEFSDKQEKVVLVAGGQQHTLAAAPANVVPISHAAAASGNPTPTARGRVIKSPFVGTFYAASSPGADPFVTVGKKVRKGDTLCIVEAMKLMNEIESEVDGVVREILIENGKPVEFDQALYVIE